ncbi:TPM domain-containing protein [soil metagenome]
MNHWFFLFRLRHKRVVQAIVEAESRTSGEIRVVVTHLKCPDPMLTAREHFEKLGMTQTRHRNGVLIFMAPRTRNFAVIGDEGVHEKCGEHFWLAVAAHMSAELREGRFTEALVHAVEESGELLARHFPPDTENRNELPDRVIID